MKAGHTWDNFCEEDLGPCVGSCVCGGECFYPPRKGVHKDQEVSDSLDRGHLSKVYLPILSWEAASHLMDWKGCPVEVGIGVSTLTCLTGADKFI